MLADREHVGTGEAARRLGVSRRTVLRWIRDGIIRDAEEMPTGRHRIPVESLEGLVRPAKVRAA